MVRGVQCRGDMARRYPNNDWIYATPAQETFLRRLRNEAFAARYQGPEVLYHDSSRRILKSEASAEISALLEAKKRGWKPA